MADVSNTLRIFTGDLKPDLIMDLTNGGAVVDLSTATSVMVVAKLNGVFAWKRAAQTPYSSTGVVTYLWQSGDTATPGQLAVEVEVTWPGTKPQTFRPPTTVHIDPDFG